MLSSQKIQKAIADIETETGFRVSSFTMTPDGNLSNVYLQAPSTSPHASAEMMEFETQAMAAGIPTSLYGRMVSINSGLIRYRISAVVPTGDAGEPLLRLEALGDSLSVPDIERPASQVLRLLQIPSIPPHIQAAA